MPGSRSLPRPAGVILLRAFVATLLLVPVIVSAQVTQMRSGDVEGVFADSGLDSESRAVIELAFEEARAGGIPDDLILPKLREGIAKRAAPDRIAAAIRDDVAFLSAARLALESVPDGEMLLAADANWDRAANFLKAGYDTRTLERIARGSATRPGVFRPATLLYVSLADWGLPDDLALLVVEAAIRSELDPDAYPEITGVLADAQRSRMDVENAAREIARMLDEGRTLRQITRVLSR